MSEIINHENKTITKVGDTELTVKPDKIIINAEKVNFKSNQ